MDVSIATTILLGTFIVLILVKVPITFSMIISTALTMIYIGSPVMTLTQQMAKQLNSFSFLAIPFFILMGEIMAAGGIATRLFQFANILVGRFTGGLAHVNVLASTFFGGISGSTIADVSSLGPLEIKMMEEAGYDKDFAIALTVSSSVQALIIPPSHNIVLYSMAAGGVSIGSLFIAGYIPGALLSISLIVYCFVISHIRKYPKSGKVPFREAIRVTKDSVLSLFSMVIVIVGVSAGWFTATESAAIACLYSLFISMAIYRELTFKDIPRILGNTVKTLAMVYALIAAAGAFGWTMSYLNIPSNATRLMLSISDNPIVILLLINILLLMLGTIMDLAPLVLIMTPILLPVVKSFGMSPIHFGIMMMLNLGIGLCTPPVGTALFTGCAIGKRSIESVTKAILPMYVPMIIILLLVTYWPALSMFLPTLLMK